MASKYESNGVHRLSRAYAELKRYEEKEIRRKNKRERERGRGEEGKEGGRGGEKKKKPDDKVQRSSDIDDTVFVSTELFAATRFRSTPISRPMVRIFVRVKM